MRIQLEQIRNRPLQWQESIELTPETMDVAALAAPMVVEVNGRIASVEDGFLLMLELETELTLRCGRCLDKFVSSADSEVELLVLVEPEEVTAGEIELEESELGLLRLEVPELDTDRLVLDQVQLAIPMSAKCSEECAGLCPQCGINRNHESCDCRPPIDLRWQTLSEI